MDVIKGEKLSFSINKQTHPKKICVHSYEWVREVCQWYIGLH